MLIFAGNSNLALGKKVARELGLTLSELEIHTFPDNENRVRVIDKVVGKDCIVVQSTGISPNLYYMELFFILDSLKRSGAKSVTLVIPYLGYQRQDHIFRSGESVSLEVIINLLSELKVDWAISLDLHSLKIEEFFKLHKIRISHVSALSIFADKIREMKLKGYVLVSPDMGGIRRIKQVSKMLDNASFISLEKNRDFKSGKIKTEKFEGRVQKNAIIIDDVISSGQTLISAAKILRESGAENIYVMATHGIFSGNAPQNLEESIIKKVIVSD
ncbi:MAG: ribose-phosphate diphosphokinase, partial [Patescibacteria group bacterium]